MKKFKLTIPFFSIAILTLFSCHKNKDEGADNVVNQTNKKDILASFCINTSQATYSDLANKVALLNDAISVFDTSSTEINLTKCKDLWRGSRSAWEQSEGFLFGPAATDNIDPKIDTWPVDYVALDSVLNSAAIFTGTYINNLDDALRGFHPVEYLLFGKNGSKKAIEFSAREKQYLTALSTNLKSLTASLSESWNNGYANHVITAGTNGSVYATQLAAYEEIVNSLIDICDEVANGKIETPFLAQDPNLEESPFSKNSITDFTNNIKSVQNVYEGKYINDGKGLEDLVKSQNLSLNASIKNKITAALNALNAITVPFGEAILTQQVQVKNAQNAIRELKNELDKNLLPFIKQHVI
ncbi:MAG: imelysin family protein [Bacteroidia bacterium]